MRRFAALLPLMLLVAMPAPARDDAQPPGERIPRHASLKSGKANLRVGPGRDYPIAWTYRRRGLPVRIIDARKGWFRLEDPEGATGWMADHLVSERRMAIVVGGIRVLRSRPDEGSRGRARLEPGGLLQVGDSRGGWCEVSGGGYTGWLRSNEVWGACVGD